MPVWVCSAIENLICAHITYRFELFKISYFLQFIMQLFHFRTLNGKFRNFDQVSKLPVWRGKAWQRFKVVSFLLSAQLRI